MNSLFVFAGNVARATYGATGSRIVGIGAGYAALGVGAVAKVSVGPIIVAAGNPLTRELGYAAERQATNVIPDPSRALEAMWAGQISVAESQSILWRHGIGFQNAADPNGNYWSYLWDRILQNERPTLDVGTVIDLWRQHQLSPLEAHWRLATHGLTRPDDPQRGAADRDLLLRDRGHYDLSTARDLWWQGSLNDADYRAALWRAGIGNDEAVNLLLTQESVAPLSEYHQWWLSGWIDDARFVSRLTREGISKPADHAHYLFNRQTVTLDRTIVDWWNGQATAAETTRRFQLLGFGKETEQTEQLNFNRPWSAPEALAGWYRGIITADQLRASLDCDALHGIARQETYRLLNRPLPAAGDIISFAVKECWDNDVVQAFGYDADFPPQLSFWMGAQGWNWGNDANTLPGAPPGGVEWAKLFWRSHWRIMSPTQGYRAFHRLRPDRIARYADRVPGLEAFNWEDLERVLRIADYPPKLRRWLAASAFAVLPIYVVRSLYRLGARDRVWLVDQLRDRGFSAEDANAMADNEDRAETARQQAAKRKREDKLQRQAIDTLLDAYATGTFTREQAVDNLKRYYVDETEAKALIDLRAARENLALVKASVARLRRGFLAGEFSPQELPGQLAVIGVVPEMVPRYIARWTLARSQERRQLSTERIVKYVAEGRIPYAVALGRLANLGWQNPDALLLLDKARRDAGELEARVADTDRMPKQKRQKELEGVVARCTKLRDKVQADLRRMTPLSAIKRWLLDHIVSVPWARERMLLMGYDDSVVSNYIQSWGIEEDKALAKTNGVAPATSEATPPDGSEQSSAPASPSGVIPLDSQGPKLTGGSVTIGEANP